MQFVFPILPTFPFPWTFTFKYCSSFRIFAVLKRCIDQELNPSQQLRKQPCGGGLTLANCQVPSQLGLSLPLLNRTWGENSMGSLSHRRKFLQDKCAPLRSLLWVSGESLLQHLEHLLPPPASLTLVSAGLFLRFFSVLPRSCCAAFFLFLKYIITESPPS